VTAGPYFGMRIPRLEDAQLLTGRARFVDDVDLPGLLHVAFLRSDEAHGRLRGIDAGAARARCFDLTTTTGQSAP